MKILASSRLEKYIRRNCGKDVIGKNLIIGRDLNGEIGSTKNTYKWLTQRFRLRRNNFRLCHFISLNVTMFNKEGSALNHMQKRIKTLLK